MKLNISQEMLDKLKRLKGKIALFTAATATVIGLAGCTNTDAITLPSDAPITSEMPSSEVPSSSEEMSSEEVSEELPSEELPSEDVVVEDVYSAESIMKYADELAAKYPIENPEHIKATLIMASLDKISEEDRVALFDAYGFTYETLEGTFKEYLESVNVSYGSTAAYYGGNESYADAANFAEKMPIGDTILADDDKELAEAAYGFMCSCFKEGTSFEEFDGKLMKEVENGTFTFADCVAYNYVMNDTENYLSPYEYFGLDITKTK